MILNNHYTQCATYNFTKAPTLAASNTWYKGAAARNTYTEIHIVDSYTPTGNEEVWNADVDNNGSIKCYANGTVLTIVGNGSGRILANEDSSLAFGGNNSTTRWSKVTEFTGLRMLDTRKVTTMERMFDGLFLVTTLDVGHFNTSNVTNMYAMFNNCEQLLTLDVSRFRTNKVTDMYAIFADCQHIKTLDVSRWNVSKVANLNSAFYDCFVLEDLDLSNWDSCGADNMGMMLYCCYALKELTFKRSASTKSTVMQAVLSDCRNLERINLDNFNTVSVREMDYFFEDCGSLTSIDISMLDTSSLTNSYQMFSRCTALREVDMNNFNIGVNSYTSMFGGCTSDLTVYVSDEAAKTWLETKVIGSTQTNITVVIGKMPKNS